jgi:hypothetical protein
VDLAELQQNVMQPIEDFQNPSQESRRLFSELLGTFFLVHGSNYIASRYRAGTGFCTSSC